MGAEIVTVSTDTVFVHLAWQRHETGLARVRYPMASDRTGALARMFGVYDEESGNALRGTFIINPQGVLLNSEVLYFNLGRNIDELMRKFKASLHLSRKETEACPSKWREEGDATLTPGAGLVGRVGETLSGTPTGKKI